MPDPRFEKLEIRETPVLAYYNRALSLKLGSFANIPGSNYSFIFTKSIKECEANVSAKLVVLDGPKGTGKSTSCLFYHKHCMDNNYPFLAISSGSLKDNNHSTLYNYLDWFIEGTEGISLDRNNCVEAINNILLKFKKKEKTVFIDVGSCEHQPTKLSNFAGMIDTAKIGDWRIIVSLSSGGYWMMSSCTDADSKDASRSFSLSIRNATRIKMQDFNDSEAELFCEQFKIYPSRRHLRNPLLLSCYVGCEDVLVGDKFVNALMVLIANTCIEALLRDNATLSYIRDNCSFLARAQQGDVLTPYEYQNYLSTYVCMEQLALIEAIDDGNYRIKAHFPDFYPLFLKSVHARLSSEYQECIARLLIEPTIRGALFEVKLLRKLRTIPVVAVCPSTKEITFFKFEVQSALYQEPSSLKLHAFKQVYHLRRFHPAIDAVCCATNALAEDPTPYLLLIQVSSSEYKNHKSRALDITKRAPAIETNQEHTLAQHYMSLFNVQQENQVIYVYISPNDLYDYTTKLEQDYFNTELTTRVPQSTHNLPNYWYGLVPQNKSKDITDIFDDTLIWTD